MPERADLHGWAETTVYAHGAGGRSSPEDGDQCGFCDEPLCEGERVHRVTEDVANGEWVHDRHVAREDGADA